MQRHATVIWGERKMKLSKAQSASIKVMELGISLGFVSGVPLVFAIALLADPQSIISLVCLLFVPLATSVVGAVAGALLLIVSTIIRVLLSK